MWTRFMDMHSGGDAKEEPYEMIYIEAPEEDAKRIFYNRFGHNPERVTCTCCGEDYSISESETLEQATGYDRGCAYDEAQKAYVEQPSKGAFSWQKFTSLADYCQRANVLVIRSDDIKAEERSGEVPQQGYVWVA